MPSKDLVWLWSKLILLYTPMYLVIYIYSCCQWYQLLIYYVGMRVGVGVYINIWVRARARLCIYAHTYSQRSFLRLETYGFITNLAVCVCEKWTLYDIRRAYVQLSFHVRERRRWDRKLPAVTLKATVPHFSRSGIQIYIHIQVRAHKHTRTRACTGV